MAETKTNHVAISSPSLSTMESVYCNCNQCNATIGLFVNLWTQIGKSYFSPIIDPDDSPAVVAQGSSRMGEKGTLVEEW